MKIAILSRKPNLYSTQRLVQAAVERNHEVKVIDVLKCFINVNSSTPQIYYGNEILAEFDAVIPRIGASATFYGSAVLRQFEMMGVYSVNASIAITRARDKLRAHQICARQSIGMPITGFAHSPNSKDALIALVGGAPLVIKLLEGTQGKGVILAESQQAAESVIDAFRGLDAYFLVQEFIEESAGRDIRCFVIGNKVVASMLRKAHKGDFRANLHRGGAAEKIKITAEERRTAIRAARAMGLNVAGVDIVRSKRGPLVLEVNSSPGLKGIETTTKLDVASMIIKYIEENAIPNKSMESGSG